MWAHYVVFITFRFNISLKQVSKIFNEMVELLAEALKPLIVFYERCQVAKTMPKAYNRMKNLRCIIDCSELFIQRPNDLLLQAATWSDYKHHNTVKFLIAITPQGSISFVSNLWGGRASDRHLVVNSGFLHYLQRGDKILADRGFPIREELLFIGADVVFPPGARGRDQLSSADIEKTKVIANTRIHVERVIRRLKCFRFLCKQIPITSLHNLDSILIICAAVVNLQGPIVSSWIHTVQD